MANATSPSPACPPGETIGGFADRDPFPTYEKWRALGSPIWDGGAQAWLVLDFEQCAAVQRDERLFANVYRDANDIVRRIKGGGANITLSTGKTHDLLRRFHLKLLSPASVERYRATHILPVVRAALDALAGREKAELHADFAALIPPRTILSLFGMPIDDDALARRILHLNDVIVQFIGAGYRGDDLRDRAVAASDELNAMLLPYVRARHDDPGEDFISRVWKEAPAAGIPVDEAAVLGLCRELYFAGSDTTVHGIANALYLLLTRPDLAMRVREGRSQMLAGLIEESLRLFNVVQFRHRVCLEDTLIGDVAVKAGQIVILVHAAANRDPNKYACPAQVDIDRRSATDHLAFGKGARSCVGSQLARMEMRCAIEALIDRYPEIALDETAAPPHFAALYMRSMAPLNVRLGRARL